MKNLFVYIRFEITAKTICVLSLLLFFSFSLNAKARDTSSIFVRPDLPREKRDALAQKLQTITGWNNLKFDDEGFLRLGISSSSSPSSGSSTAREFLLKAISDNNQMIIEDASNRKDVVFCQVVEGRWTNNVENKTPVYVIEIDFADFDRLIGDEKTLNAFNEGWGLLHEISHVVNNSVDAEHADELGECETLINKMRRECSLPERAEYFHSFCPGAVGSEFSARLVRLAFDFQQPNSKKKKRYWLIWDANLVGGLEKLQNMALR